MNQELFNKWMSEATYTGETLINTYVQEDLYVALLKLDDGRYCERFYEQDKVFPHCFKVKDLNYLSEEEADIIISFEQAKNGETTGAMNVEEAQAYLQKLMNE
ncbi:hypothetical protein F8154_11050 [Alkaliphilus pronyensis]|uniref:Uncharacterized protein n=1 Tax=Alkaliphilus pronyensis TaxID=1482732 RepID=A0A6I0F9J9_9FIRM|nr:hypothetical protein [Alkaliphilus pronyensis]KAB3532930.1 hypothetical protein F8154_11050 [Alkaliphilus pronyensis]